MTTTTTTTTTTGEPLKITKGITTERMRFSVSDIAFATLRDAGGAEEAAVDVTCDGVAQVDTLGLTVHRPRFTVRRTVPLIAAARASEEDTRPLLCIQEPREEQAIAEQVANDASATGSALDALGVAALPSLDVIKALKTLSRKCVKPSGRSRRRATIAHAAPRREPARRPPRERLPRGSAPDMVPRDSSVLSVRILRRDDDARRRRATHAAGQRSVIRRDARAAGREGGV